MALGTECKCGKSLRVPDGSEGRIVECPGCKTHMRAPASEEAEIVTHVSVVDELEKLARLRKRGVLTQDEFDTQKRKLLDGSSPPGITSKDLRLLTIAKAQKGVLLCVLVNLAASAIRPLLLAAIPMQACYVYKLPSGLGKTSPGLWTLGMFVPVLCLVLLLLLNSKATQALQTHGIRM